MGEEDWLGTSSLGWMGVSFELSTRKLFQIHLVPERDCGPPRYRGLPTPQCLRQGVLAPEMFYRFFLGHIVSMPNRMRFVNAQSHETIRHDGCMRKETLGDRIRALIEEHGETQEDLAKAAGLNQANVSRAIAKNGQRQTQDPGISIVWAAAVRFKVPVRYLVCGGSKVLHDPQDPQEAHAVSLLRKMDEKNKKAWLASGEVLAAPLTSVDDPDARREKAMRKLGGSITAGVKLNAEVINVTQGGRPDGATAGNPADTRGKTKKKSPKSR